MRVILATVVIIFCYCSCSKTSDSGVGIGGKYAWSGGDTVVEKVAGNLWDTSVNTMNDTFSITELNGTQIYADYYLPLHMFDGEEIADTMTLISYNKSTNTLIYRTPPGARFYNYFTSPTGAVDTVAFEILTVMRNQHMMYYDSYQTDHYGEVWNVHLSAKMR